MIERGKPYKLMAPSGEKFFFDDPASYSYPIADIAWCCAGIFRYTGGTRETLCQHLVLASEQVEPRLALAALLHDAHEGMVGDWASPFKAWMRQHDHSDVLKLEKDAEACLQRAYGIDLSPEDKAAIKLVDMRLAMTELRDLMPPTDTDDYWHDVAPYEWTLSNLWPPADAERIFLRRFFDVVGRL